VHAPGLYARGAQSEVLSHQLPLMYWICFSIGYMSVAGFFPGVIWQRTKNILLLIALHAIFDLVPNLKEFISAWHIQ
jgi:membrane protease YdiL (CAAX protease family)